jgi:hypothetical protein
MPVPDFSPGEIWTAGAADSIGLWLVKTQTIGTGVSSVEVTSAFSSTYDNYLITVNGGAASTTAVLRMTLGATVTNYYYSLIFSAWNATPLSEGATNALLWTGLGFGRTSGLQMAVNLYNPNRAMGTSMVASRITTAEAGTTTGFLDNSTQYTSFTISPTSGTLTGGTIRVYGYRS